jgi:hypothetical protein
MPSSDLQNRGSALLVVSGSGRSDRADHDAAAACQVGRAGFTIGGEIAQACSLQTCASRVRGSQESAKLRFKFDKNWDR